MHDTRVGRFFARDPLTRKYPFYSPYAFSGNRVIDSRELEGLEPLTVHKTIDAAAINFGQFYNDNSIRDNQEYGSTIYAVNDKSGAVIGYTYSIANIGVTGSTVTVSQPPNGQKGVADIHTHAASTENAPERYYDNIFSGAEATPQQNMAQKKFDIGGNNRKCMNGYVATPNGSLQKYDVDTGVITILPVKLPADSGKGNGEPSAGIAAPSTWSYTLKKGDTLSSMAKQYNTTVQEISAENKITDPNKVKSGTKLKITN
ncbi:MAG: hypothetical protein CFE21_22805 [Bacteroidetes bacterium B1(2017)]|nr:MAG: hypothetical protein CFE21_22805 [Bacteroidetes bacterium B1(2017)]